MTDAERAYQYQPVKAKEMRLLSIGAGSGWSDELHCTISHVSVWKYYARQSYEALSYVWGDAATLRPLQCGGPKNNGIIYVTENCLSAIRRLRRETETRVVWIDAICINQRDLQERSAQVDLMPDIYSQAEDVLVYLGEHYENSHLAMDMIGGFISIQND